VEKITYGCATRVYPNSKGLYDFIRKGGYAPERKVKVIAEGSSNGIDTGFFNPEVIPQGERDRLKMDLGIGPEDFVMVFVGRMVGDKGVNELVGAFERLR
jgi:glycosyltransferase involved in cell wall biosynthesis